MDLPCPIKQQGNNAFLLPIQPLGETLEDSRASKKVSKPFSPPQWVVTLLHLRSLNHEWRTVMEVGLLSEAPMGPLRIPEQVRK